MGLEFSWPIAMIALGAFMTFFGKPRILSGKSNTYAGVALMVAGLFVGGFLSGIPLGDLGTTQNSVGQIASVTLSAGTYNASSTYVAVDSVNKQQFIITVTDALSVEDYYANGTATLLRKGDASAQFVDASCTSSDYKNPSDASDTVNYNIVSKDTTNEVECYINGVQGKNTIGFAEGTASSAVALAWKWSEAGADKTIQYDNRYVTFNLGGQIVTFKVTRIEAAS